MNQLSTAEVIRQTSGAMKNYVDKELQKIENKTYDVATNTLLLDFDKTNYIKLTIDTLQDNITDTSEVFQFIVVGNDGYPVMDCYNLICCECDTVYIDTNEMSNIKMYPSHFYEKEGNTDIYFTINHHYSFQIYITGLLKKCNGASIELIDNIPQYASPISIKPSTSGTQVTSGGSPVNTWNADTKLDTGKSMEYTTNGALRVYKMDGGANGTRTDTRLEMRGDAFDARNSSASSQYGPGSFTINDTANSNSVSLYPNYFITKKNGTKSSTLRLPDGQNGTLATTDDINNAISNFKNNVFPSITKDFINSFITSKGEWIAADSFSQNYTVPPGKGYIIAQRANTASAQSKFVYKDENGVQNSIQSETLLVFIPKETYWNQLYRVFLLVIELRDMIPSVEVRVVNAQSNTMKFTTTGSTAIDRLIFEY